MTAQRLHRRKLTRQLPLEDGGDLFERRHQGLEESVVFRVEFDHAIFGVSIKFFTGGRFAARCREMQ